MTAEPAAVDPAAQAWRAAEAAAHRSGVTLTEADDMEQLRAVSTLLASVWGRNDEGVPVNSEVQRSLVHSGGCVTIARDGDGRLAGAAVLAVAAPAGSTYSMIAAVAPGTSDRGIGRTLKLRQRAWALANGFRSMRWTFDPLVSRNARFNLAKLGAEAVEYESAFYGRMSDDLNGDDDSDRLVAHWPLDAARAVAAAQGTGPDPVGPDEHSRALRQGPDGSAMLRGDDRGLWCRVPADVVALRRGRPAEASQWRAAVREVLTAAFADGLVATHLTRDSWYLLTESEERR
jgi:predicted GNAT superfamily acetyltransferase